MKILILLLSVCSCQAVIENCQHPPLENGFFIPHLDVYKNGVNVSYGCKVGLKPALEPWQGGITCRNGTWSRKPQCIATTSCLAPQVSKAKPSDPLADFYPSASSLTFVCDKGYKFDGTDSAFCLNATWSLPVCKRKRYTCDSPARVLNATVLHTEQDIFEHGKVLKYICAPVYEQAAIEFMTCLYGIWTPAPMCDRILNIIGELSYSFVQDDVSNETLLDPGRPEIRTSPVRAKYCRTLPNVENGLVLQLKGGQRLSVECLEFYKLVGPNTIRCLSGRWSELPVCKPPCELDQALFDSSHPDRYLKEGEKKTFLCRGFKERKKEMTIVCVNGKAIYGELTSISTMCCSRC